MGVYRIRYQDYEVAIPNGVFVIGRAPECHFRLSGVHVSRRHASLSVNGRIISVADLGSRNGVVVNGRAINRAVRLAHLDVVSIGLDALTILDEAIAPAKLLPTDRPPPAHERSDADDADAVTAQVRLETLSRREREVFELMALGHTHREIAQKLFVSVKTVETHRTRIGEKLGCRNLREIIHCAFIGGVLPNRT